MLGILYRLPQTVIITLRFYSYFMVKGTEAQMDNGHEMSKCWSQDLNSNVIKNQYQCQSAFYDSLCGWLH